ncbi:MAG: helicase-related protein [Candidatus Parvarchaeum sp.]
MTKIIDNSRNSLASVLLAEMKHVNEIAIASAYFNLKGYELISEELKKNPLKLLLGREPTESVKFEEDIITRLESFEKDFIDEQKDLFGAEIVANEDDEGYFSLLQDAFTYFKRPEVQVRKVNGRFFHGKAYIGAKPSFSDVISGFAIVGSSNFTGGGLSGNRELNMLSTDREGVTELVNWFTGLWKENNSVDFKTEFLKLLENYVTTHSPYEVVAKALYEVYKPQLEETRTNNLMKTLYPHQVLSTIQATRILNKYNGVVIADSTGLGKTRVAINLGVMAINEGRNPLLIAPKSALDTTWKDEMDKTHIHIDSKSSEYLSQHPEELIKEYSDKDFIIVDEAHYFKATSSNRYESLRDLMASGNKQIVLLTATPINNGLMDLYSLLSLYLRDDSISDISPSLKSYFSVQQKLWKNNKPVDMDSILRRFVVRTSRDTATALSKNKLKFPIRKLDNNALDRYEIDVDYEKLYSYLEDMNFIYYDYAIDKLGRNLTLPDGTPIPTEMEKAKKNSLKGLVKTIVKINFFMRLESSIYAFQNTLLGLSKYIKISRDYAKAMGYFLPPRIKGDITEMLDEDGKWVLPNPEYIFSGKNSELKEKCKLSDIERDEFIKKCESDLYLISKVQVELPKKDNKLLQLIKRISLIKLSDNNGVIIFTQYSDTANYIYGELKKELKYKVMLTTGSISINKDGKKTDKTSVIREFMKNGGYLVSTDVLSESQNLQNAQYVVNYDFPWNPVVLIQRAGRIDRLGSQYDEIYLINILPINGNETDKKSISHFLKVMNKLYNKIELISQTIGIDSSTLGEEVMPRDFGIQEAIARNDPKILDILKQKIDLFSKDPIETLSNIMNEKGEKWLIDIPTGIGAYKHSNREGIFILFKNNNNFYWILKFLDGNKEIIQNPNEIINILLDGDHDNSGEKINYTHLVKQFREIKSWLRAKIEDEKLISDIQQGRKIRATNQEREILVALQQSGDEGIRLSALFNVARAKQSIVTTLYKALVNGKLLEKAKEVLKEIELDEDKYKNNEQEANTNLKRICWCWIKKT